MTRHHYTIDLTHWVDAPPQEGVAFRSPTSDDGETLAAFNASHHFGALWRDPLADEALALHMPVIVEGGVTEANIKATFRWWRETIRAFDRFMENR